MPLDAGDVTERIARSVEMLVRLKVEEIKGNRTKSDMIRFLANLGATTSEIVSFLAVPLTTVAPIVSKAKASAKPKKSRTAGRKRNGR